MDKFLFIEDARTYRSKVKIFMTIFYVCSFFLLGIVLACIFEYRDLKMIIISIMFFALSFYCAIYMTWGLKSKYLKYYMFINENEFKFFADNEEHITQIKEFVNYEILKDKGRYKVIRLNFKSERFIITSFKSDELLKVLNDIINKNKEKI